MIAESHEKRDGKYIRFTIMIFFYNYSNDNDYDDNDNIIIKW